MSSGTARRILRASGVALLACTSAGLVAWSGLLATVEHGLGDERFRIRGSLGPSTDVVLVGIDENAFRDLHLRWPFPRAVHGRVIHALLRAGARAIIYDVQFSEPSNSHDDHALIAAASDPRVVMTVVSRTRSGHPYVIGWRRLHTAGTRFGSALFPFDDDGVWRRLQPKEKGLPNLAYVATRRPATGPDYPINFLGPPGTVKEIPFAAVAQRDFAARDVRGKIVLVGATAPTLQDFHSTPMPGGMPGVEAHADAVQTVLDGFPLRWASPLTNVILVLLGGCFVPSVSLLRRPGRSVLPLLGMGLASSAAFLVLAQVAFNAGTIIVVTPPLVAIAVGTAGSATLTYATETRARRRLERYVSPAVATELLRRDESGSRLPAEQLEATVVFCDLRGFTSFAERQAPDTVIAVLDKYLAMVSASALAHDGTVVSYQGDGVMIAFGAPVRRADHAASALSLAIELVDVVLPRLNGWLCERYRAPDGFRVGVGIHTGPVMCGSVGSDQRLEYAVVGDTTNVAARLQGLSQTVGAPIVVSEATRRALSERAIASTELNDHGTVELRGRDESIHVYTMQPLA